MDENPDRDPNTGHVGAPPTPKKRLLVSVVNLLVVLGIIGIAIALLLPAMRTTGEAARRNACQNNLKQIAVALKHYAQVHGALPPAYTTDTNGKPLHSWRTLILPFIEEQQLYQSIDRTKPWDDPANAKAFQTSVPDYHCPSMPDRDNHTTYLAIVTPNSCFRPTEPRNLADITDGVRETLMVIEVDTQHAVPWMKPVDADENVVLGIGPDSELAHPGGVTAAFVDGHVAFLEAYLTAAQRRALISIAGNDKAAFDDAD